MLCEVCKEHEAEDKPTGYQGPLTCRGCDLLAQLADARGRVKALKEESELKGALYLEMEARNHKLQGIVNEAIVRLENASGPFANELHRDAKMLRRRLIELDGGPDDGA
jgi:hypothetical protein